MKVDSSKIWFHGSSEARINQIQSPSFEHPFYVTTDLHYAMAFCTKDSSNTGDWDVQKTFTPASQNYVYVVSLKPNCKIFDFRNQKNSEFKELYKIIDKDIVDWVLESKDTFDRKDIYEFIITLQLEVLQPIEEDKTYSMYYDRRTNAAGHLNDPYERLMSKELFEKAAAFMHSNGLEHAYRDMDIHEIMAPILKKLNKLGFHGILTVEHDSNNERKYSSRVTTTYAVGMFDVAGLDQLGLIPMRYSWLKKINPTYLQDMTTDDANQKIKRFIQLYKEMFMKKPQMTESVLDKKTIWYFGNNRSKNLKLNPPRWYAPFFVTSSYRYAQEYSDYGTYTIILKNEIGSKILDFSNMSDTRKLKWPKIVIDKINEGGNDLNSIAYDLYILAFDKNDPLMYIDRNTKWIEAAEYFKQKSKNIFVNVELGSSIWGSEKDHKFLLQMWKDIYDAGFDGFTHNEFGNKVLSIFNFHCIDKISVKPIDGLLNENKKQRTLKKLLNKNNSIIEEEKENDDNELSFMKLRKFASSIDMHKLATNVANAMFSFISNAIDVSFPKLRAENANLFNKIIDKLESEGQIVPLFAVHYPSTNVNILFVNDFPLPNRFSYVNFVKSAFRFVKQSLHPNISITAIPFKVENGDISLDRRDIAYLQCAMTLLLSDIQFDALWPIKGDISHIMKYLDYICPSVMDVVGCFTVGGASIAARAAKISTKNAIKKGSKTMTKNKMKLLAKLKAKAPKNLQKNINKARKASKLSRSMKSNIKDKIQTDHYVSENDSISTKTLNQCTIQKFFDHILDQYFKRFGFDLSYMKFIVDNQPVYTNGEPCYEYDEDECAGDWTQLGWIRLNPDMKSVMDRYGVAWHGSDDIEEFTKLIIAHELAHEVWNNIADDQFKNDVIEKANDENFSTTYLETVNTNKLAEETFCEYLAHQIVQQRKKIDFPEEEIRDLSRRKHIVTHRVSDDALLFNVGDIVDVPWQIPYKVVDKVVVNDIYDSPYVYQLSQEQLEYLQQFDNIAILDLIAQYDPPYTLEQIKTHYPENIYVELANDPVHRWRAETGIELIHKEPTKEELDRIWKNWQLMPQEMKDISDKKSIELFGCTNAKHYSKLKASEDHLNENKATYLQKYRCLAWKVAK